MICHLSVQQQNRNHTLLTLADKNAHNAICEILKSNNIPVLSEEGKSIDYSERSKWEYFWMVDPLDGTKEFVKRNGEFTVNIALIHKQKSILGVIYVPVTKTLYFAAEGIGCYKSEILNPKSEIASLQELLKSSSKLPLETTTKKFTVIASRSHLSEETQMFIDGLKIDFLVGGF